MGESTFSCSITCARLAPLEGSQAGKVEHPPIINGIKNAEKILRNQQIRKAITLPSFW
jgi:hypothetical protein